jgi:Cu+-exporting ATPase
MITGEPLPVTRGPGDAVIGGTQNVDGALRVRVSKIGSETALAQIIQLVERAQSTKPAVQRLADQIAAVFVPSVLAIALVTGIGWYLFGTLHHWDSPHTWGMLARAVCSVLIIACPCALGLAVPATLMVGTGMGAKRGILIRDIDALQTAERIDAVVLDKTGTITQGKPVVAGIQSLDSMPPNEILRLAASAEQYSEHPLAKAIVRHAEGMGLSLVDPEAFSNEPGAGVAATVEGLQIRIGSELFLRSVPSTGDRAPRHGLETRATGTQVFVAVSENLVGVIEISDQIKVDSTAAIDELHRMKLKTLLLSGDNEAAAQNIAKTVGIDDVRANVKPDQKAQVIRELQEHLTQSDEEASMATLTRREHPKVAMVGDGINDAPALAQADLGIAIGSGSDIAKETGDIVLVGGSLLGIATAIRLSRATMTKIRQNLFLAFIYNVLAIPLAALGLLNPLIAAAAMALSDVTVIGNALLLRRAKIDPNLGRNAT